MSAFLGSVLVISPSLRQDTQHQRFNEEFCFGSHDKGFIAFYWLQERNDVVEGVEKENC